MGELTQAVDTRVNLSTTHSGGNMEPSSDRTDQQHRRFVDRERFRSVMGHFASGVTIITTCHEGIDYGLTASAVSSLSLDPPMLLICVNKTSHTRDAIEASRVFAVNILRENQSEVARQFATSRPDKFAGLSASYGALDVPLLDDMLATIECRVTEIVTGGTHAVFLAEVETAQATEGMPLTYFRGRMGRLADTRSQHAVSLWRDMQWEDAA
jgi:4-nitrophenol 2-monooxygenase / 4-nitrocatechol 4-monooxygenase, reductase component